MTMIKGADGRLYAIDRNYEVMEKAQTTGEALGFSVLGGGSVDIQSSASIIH